MPKRQKHTKRIIIVSVIIAIGLVCGGIIAFNTLKPKSSIQTGVQPTFQAVLPTNTSIEDLGGWQKLTPPNSDPFYVYVDEIDSVLIKVSQQSLPKDFSSNSDSKVAEIAQAYNANETLNANGTKVYIGSSAKGPQSLIFSKNELLILIVSQQKIQDDAWISYINSLR